MAARQSSAKRAVHRYTSGIPYRLAVGRGREDPAPVVADRLARQLAVIDLSTRPSISVFARSIRRELKIRCYATRTIRSYMMVVRSVLRWSGLQPNRLTREHVREYLEYLYDAGHGPSDIAVHLSAIRTVWDKFCYYDVTLGLETPRRGRRKPVILSRDEVRLLLAAANSLRDTLLLGLMYGAGLRISEVVRVRWSDIDQDRNQIFIRQAKGNADRHVQLPKPFRDLIGRSSLVANKSEFVFPSQSAREGRHISPRTVQRAMRHACRIAGIKKKATPHSLRHAFATHSFEAGCDIRRIQKVLGHVNLETTTIYVTVAKERTDFASPWDRLENNEPDQAKTATKASSVAAPMSDFRLHCRRDPSVAAHVTDALASHQLTLEARENDQRYYLTGTFAKQTRPGFIQIDLPPLEQWQPVIDQMPARIRERLQTVEFYELLRDKIRDKLLRQITRNSPP